MKSKELKKIYRRFAPEHPRKVRVLRAAATDPYFENSVALRRALAAAGFADMPPLLPTPDGCYCLEQNAALYALEQRQEWLPLDFRRPRSCTLAAESLARFHLAAAKAAEPQRRFAEGRGSTLPAKFGALLAAAEQAAPAAGIDVTPVLRRGERALTRLCASELLPLCHAAQAGGTVAYGAADEQGLGFAGKRVLLCDFTRLREDPRLLDVYDLLRRALSAGADAPALLKTYVALCPLSREEREALASLLCFPLQPLRYLKKLALPSPAKKRRVLTDKLARALAEPLWQEGRNDHEVRSGRPRRHTLSRHGHRHLYLAVDCPFARA